MAIVVIVAFLVLFSSSKTARGMLLQGILNAEIRWSSMQKKMTQVDGHEIVYLERASTNAKKEIVILLHGFTAEKNNWMRFAKHLDASYQLLLIDLPAHGQSSYFKEMDYGIEAQAERIIAFMDALEIESAHLVGSSMGGAIAAMAASQHSDRVITLTLFNAAGADNPNTDSVIERAILRGQSPLVVTDAKQFKNLLKLSMEKDVFIPWPVSSALADLAISRSERYTKVFNDIYPRIANLGVNYLREIDAPTLVIWGDKDHILDVGNAKIFVRNIPQSKAIIYKNVGHIPMIEIPEQSANDFSEFLDQATRQLYY